MPQMAHAILHNEPAMDIVPQASSSPLQSDADKHHDPPYIEGPVGSGHEDKGIRTSNTHKNDLPPVVSDLFNFSNSPPGSQDGVSVHSRPEHEAEEPPEENGFLRSTSPISAMSRSRTGTYEKVGEGGVSRMHKFSLYETASRYFLVGADIMDRRFRILKIDRTAEVGDLSIAEDDIVYNKKEKNLLLNTIDEGNKASGGLKLRSSTWGLLGFIRFTGEYYMLLVTKRSQVAMIGGHYVYQIDGTELVPLIPASGTRSKQEYHLEEARFVGILNNLDLTRSFYFSYSYDITHTLQHNICREREALSGLGDVPDSRTDYNGMFIWNHHLLEPAKKNLKNTYDWCLPITHGFVDQATLSVYGRTVYITIIARRSRFFAGARFLKRGANDLGYVANDVETEQIVSEMLTTSFHAPGPKLYANPNYTSYVQHRGSIPLYWTQDSTGVTPRPDIELNLIDPFYSAAALHFDDLFERYGAPIFVLNLIKARERTPRESILLREYTKAVNYLNQLLPEDKKIIYKAWDMSRASKNRDQDVIGTLESIAEDVLKTTSFFHNGDSTSHNVKMQNGVARTNCIDCLDRTNAAQFVIGKLALGYQLHALGVISGASIDYDTDAVNLFTHMYHDHGDTIAIQYGGSHLVNTMETYRKINQWTSQSRDMVESFKRYYNNSFLDAQRQEAYNLFLGNYVFVQGQPMLWDLSTDYYLHHADPRKWSSNQRRSYRNWYTPENLVRRDIAPCQAPLRLEKPLSLYDDYWVEYYRPLALTSFHKLFSSKMNSAPRHIPYKLLHEGRYDFSPFHVRIGHDPETGEKTRSIKDLPLQDPARPRSSGESSLEPLKTPPQVTFSEKLLITPPKIKRTIVLTPYPDTFPDPRPARKVLGSTPVTATTVATKDDKTPKDKLAIAQWTLSQFVLSSLSPSVAASEMDEYGRYISHPLNLPLVVSTETPRPSLATPSFSHFQEYINSVATESKTGAFPKNSTAEDITEFEEFLSVGEEPLTVKEEDGGKKRYKAYSQWLKGKSIFKQQRVDP